MALNCDNETGCQEQNNGSDNGFDSSVKVIIIDSERVSGFSGPVNYSLVEVFSFKSCRYFLQSTFIKGEANSKFVCQLEDFFRGFIS